MQNANASKTHSYEYYIKMSNSSLTTMVDSDLRLFRQCLHANAHRLQKHAHGCVS